MPYEPVKLSEDKRRLLKAQADKAELELGVLQGRYMLHETHDQILTGLGLEVVRGLESIEKRLPPRCDMVPARQVAAELAEAHREFRERLARVRGGPLRGLRRGRGGDQKTGERKA